LLRYAGQTTFGRDRLAPDAPLEYAVYAGMLLTLLVAAWLSYRLFESHTFRMRRAVKNVLQPRPQRAPMASSSMK
jgi:peptidoglycan/LPS O-acetylase OafA/YrhL